MFSPRPEHAFMFVWVALFVVLAPGRMSYAAPEAAAGPGPGPWSGSLAIEACEDPPPTLPKGADAALRATLLVNASEGVGSAVLISPDGFALTAAHVVPNDTFVEIVGRTGARTRAEVVRVDEGRDVALLKLELLGTTPCLQPTTGQAPIGSDIFVLGSPAGEELSFSMSKGIVSGHREINSLHFVQLDASVNPGNSGGPVLDVAGTIVGLASWKVSHVTMEGLSFAVPIDVALDALELEFALQTDPAWHDRRGRLRVAPAPQTPSPTSTAEFLATRRRERIYKGLIGWGIGAGVIGGAMVVTTGAVHLAEVPMGDAAWKTAVALNTTGWLLGAAGGGLLVGGLLARAKEKKRKVAVVPGGLGVVAVGRF